jgi:PHD-finger/Prokaryotic RING finger family 2
MQVACHFCRNADDFEAMLQCADCGRWGCPACHGVTEQTIELPGRSMDLTWTGPLCEACATSAERRDL